MSFVRLFSSLFLMVLSANSLAYDLFIKNGSTYGTGDELSIAAFTLRYPRYGTQTEFFLNSGDMKYVKVTDNTQVEVRVMLKKRSGSQFPLSDMGSYLIPLDCKAGGLCLYFNGTGFEGDKWYPGGTDSNRILRECQPYKGKDGSGK